MTDQEIYRSYQTAKRTEAQIRILAELNQCTIDEIRAAIRRARGMDAAQCAEQAEGAAARQGRSLYDWKGAKALYDQGENDLKIALALGCTRQRVTQWRHENNLLPQAQVFISVLEEETGVLKDLAAYCQKRIADLWERGVSENTVENLNEARRIIETTHQGLIALKAAVKDG